MLFVLALAMSACKEPIGIADAAPTAPEAAVRATGGSRAAVSGAFTVDAMTIETRYWPSGASTSETDGYTDWTSPPPEGLAALSTFESLARDVAGYTNRPIELPSLQCGLITPGVQGAPPWYDDGALPSYNECIKNPGDGSSTSHRNIAMRYRARVTASKGVSLRVRWAVDFVGGVLMVDGRVVDQKWNDPFWNGFFETDNGDLAADGLSYIPLIETDTSTVLTAALHMSAGSTHVIEVIGFENGADFGASAQFNDGSGWIDAVSMVPSYRVPLSVSVGAGGGSVTSEPAAIACSAMCTASFAWATMPALTAHPAQYFAFSNWSGACTGSGWCAPLMETPKSVTANFTRVQWPLQVTLAGTGSGTVTSGDNVINCGSSCLDGFSVGSTVTLTATSGANSVFAGWSGGGCSGTGPCVVLMDQARNVTATFQPDQFALSVTSVGTGTGVVTSSPAGITCGTQCAWSFEFGSTVVLTAEPASGSIFGGWSGACAGSQATCTVEMSQLRTVTATFTVQSGDATAPVISCTATPAVLWPVNHKMVKINVLVSLTDASEASFKLLSVVSNEPPNVRADGTTAEDIDDWDAGSDDVEGKLRAERAGDKNDRVYTLWYRGTDASGNFADTSCAVTVPHDKR
ncbi:MAG: InlB B-repeat-containing protein [Gemmatimonadaceae bacterium]